MSSNGTASTSSLFVSSVSPSEPVSTASSVAPSPSAAPSSEPSATPSPSPTPSPSDTEPSSAAEPSSEEPPSSTPISVPSSNTPQPSSQAPSSTPEPSSDAQPTSVITASSRAPSTQVITSVVTPSATKSGETPSPSVVVITVTPSDSANASNGSPTTGSATATGTSDPSLASVGKEESGSGLNKGGKTAIAVVVPVVVVALLVVAGIFLWKKRKQRKHAEEARRKEVEEYGFNPNNDPTLPAVAMQSEMAEDQSGYRGWGNTTTSSNRKASTTLTSGMTYSDGGSNPGGYQSPNSPTQGTYSDGHSGDPLVNGRRETLDSEGIGALGAAPNASQNQSGVHRGPSNASSSYSAANHSDNSGDYPMPMNHQQDYYDNNGYYQTSPYGDNGYGGNQQPIIRDVSARRNTRIENPSVFPQQGNSGIAQNF